VQSDSGTLVKPNEATGLSISCPSELIDLDRYPIVAQDSESYQQLVASCRKQLKSVGACVLPDFIKTEAVAALAKEAEDMAPKAYHNTLTGNAYLTELDQSLPSDHPRNWTSTTALGAVAYDLIPEQALIRQLYEWDGLMLFLKDALNKETFYRYADPMGGLNIAVMKKGDHLRWHFDQTDFVTTILLQESQGGGEYEFVPMIRTPDNESYESVKKILNGSTEGVLRLDISPGSLVLFEGRHSLHRVTPIEGERLRLIALLGYDTRPGVVSSNYLRNIRYGRTV
jgi:hypothetical protein